MGLRYSNGAPDSTPGSPAAGSRLECAVDDQRGSREMTKRMQQRRTFIKQGAALSAAAAAGALGFPAIVRGQAGPLKVGILHPVTGPLAYSGQLSRLGATIEGEGINAAGGLKSIRADVKAL